MKSWKKRFAFTLAEVLITLGIIGVVASITIPTLMNNIQDAQLKTAWKKAYSVLSQATSQIVKDNGGTLKGICNNLDAACIATQFGKYIKIISVCTDNSAYQCFPKPFFLSGGPDNADAPAIISATNDAILILNDGTNILIRYHDSTCSFTNGNPCGWMFVDVNGLKPPNKFGKDVYGISIFENKILPYGANGAFNSGTDDCNTSGQGFSCASSYLYQ